MNLLSQQKGKTKEQVNIAGKVVRYMIVSLYKLQHAGYIFSDITNCQLLCVWLYNGIQLFGSIMDVIVAVYIPASLRKMCVGKNLNLFD